MEVLFNKFKRALKKGKGQDGFTLVEVIVALFIISILTGVVIHSTTMALNTSQINQAKTVALNIVNEEIEKIRAMDYQDIGLTGSDPEGILEAQVNTEDGYMVNYNIEWADDGQNYKQVSVSAYKQPMVKEVKVFTQIFPSADSGSGQQDAEYPAPYNLVIVDDNIVGQNRTVVLSWNTPDTDLTITGYNVYRNHELIGNSLNNGYIDNPEVNYSYTYYVTAVYEQDIESDHSNEVYTEPASVEYLPPTNLQILSDEGKGANRRVELSWDAPQSEMAVAEYNIYRDGSFVQSTIQTNFTDSPGNNSTVTYYVTAIYEDGTESEPSETQSS